MGYLDLSAVTVVLPDGRAVLDEVSLRVGEGARMALVGPNGSGKTTLLRVASGDLPVGGAGAGGAVVGAGGLGVMRQLIGQIHDDSTVRDLLVAVAPPRIGAAAAEITRTELLMMERDEHDDQLAYAQALADWADVGGYEWETLWDVCTVPALGVPYERAQYRSLRTLSGGEQKRLALEALLRGPDEVLLLDEPDNFLDVPGKRWLEEQLVGCDKTVLFVSHDRELLARVATRVATLEPSSAGSRLWVHPGGFATYDQARVDRNDRLEEQRRRWDEEHAKLRELVVMYRQKAAYNSDMAARLQAARTRLRRFEEAGPPEDVPVPQRLRMRLTGGRTAKRSIIAEQCELTGLMQAFDLEVWYGDRVAVLGSNGSGKSHFLRLLAQGGSDPSPEHALVAAVPDGAGERAGSARTAGEAGAPDGGPGGHRVAHTGTVRLGSRVRPGWFAQTHDQPQLRGRTLLEILHRGDDHRTGRPRDEASRALDRYGLARAGEQRFESLSGGQQARFQILLLELSGATLLLLDEPTDNLDLVSAEALEEALDAFDGTVVAVTHDRWFARRFDRFVVFGADGTVYESPEPVWDEARVRRAR